MLESVLLQRGIKTSSRRIDQARDLESIVFMNGDRLVLIDPGSRLWLRDNRWHKIAGGLGVSSVLVAAEFLSNSDFDPFKFALEPGEEPALSSLSRD